MAAKGTIQEVNDAKQASQPVHTETQMKQPCLVALPPGVTSKPRSAGLQGLKMQWGVIDKHNKREPNRRKEKDTWKSRMTTTKRKAPASLPAQRNHSIVAASVRSLVVVTRMFRVGPIVGSDRGVPGLISRSSLGIVLTVRR